MDIVICRREVELGSGGGLLICSLCFQDEQGTRNLFGLAWSLLVSLPVEWLAG
jgi:hypothetical protein